MLRFDFYINGNQSKLKLIYTLESSCLHSKIAYMSTIGTLEMAQTYSKLYVYTPGGWSYTIDQNHVFPALKASSEMKTTPRNELITISAHKYIKFVRLVSHHYSNNKFVY